MTIETRLSFPQGGVECPPDETPLSLPTPSSSSDSNGCVESNANRKPIDRKSNKNGRKRKIKNRGAKCLLKNVIHYAGPLKETCRSATRTSGNEEELDMESQSSTLEKSADLKKAKAKCTCTSSKDEAASRKSMRLRLRRMNGEDIFPSKRPRYFENLNSIDFENDSIKIQFLDALELSPINSKPIAANPELLKDGPRCSSCNLTNNEKESKFFSNSKIIDDNPIDLADGESHQPLTFNSGKISIMSPLIGRKLCPNTVVEEEEKWKYWIKRVPIFHFPVENFNSSPSNAEIKESLERLTNLGTEVKLVTSCR